MKTDFALNLLVIKYSYLFPSSYAKKNSELISMVPVSNLQFIGVLILKKNFLFYLIMSRRNKFSSIVSGKMSTATLVFLLQTRKLN